MNKFIVKYSDTIKLIFTSLIVIALLFEIGYTGITVYRHRRFVDNVLAQPEVVVHYENSKIEGDWYDGVYMLEYTFTVVQDGISKTCELDRRADKDFLFQKDLKLRFYKGNVYTESGGLVLCQHT